MDPEQQDHVAEDEPEEESQELQKRPPPPPSVEWTNGDSQASDDSNGEPEEDDNGVSSDAKNNDEEDEGEHYENRCASRSLSERGDESAPVSPDKRAPSSESSDTHPPQSPPAPNTDGTVSGDSFLNISMTETSQPSVGSNETSTTYEAEFSTTHTFAPPDQINESVPFDRASLKESADLDMVSSTASQSFGGNVVEIEPVEIGAKSTVVSQGETEETGQSFDREALSMTESVTERATELAVAAAEIIVSTPSAQGDVLNQEVQDEDLDNDQVKKEVNELFEDMMKNDDPPSSGSGEFLKPLYRTSSIMTDATNISTFVNPSSSVGDGEDMDELSSQPGEVSSSEQSAAAGGQSASAASFAADTVTHPPISESAEETCSDSVIVHESSDYGNYTQQSSEDSAVEEDWVDVLGSGTLLKKVLRRGYGEGTKPQKGETVTVSFTAYTLPEERKFREEQAFTFVLGDNEVFDGMDFIVQLMEMNEKASVKCAPRFAYGNFGCKKHDIGPDVWILFTIELLNSRDTPSPKSLSRQQVENLLQRKKDKGNYHFARNEWDNAIMAYTQALKVLDQVEQVPAEEKRTLQVQLYNNMAQTQLNAKVLRAAVISCDAALQLDPDNMKSLYRKARALQEFGELEHSLAVYSKAREKYPRDAAIHKGYTEVKSLLKEKKGEEKELYRKMVDPSGSLSAKNPVAEGDQPSWYWQAAVVVALVGMAATVLAFLLFEFHD